ncbi:MAG: N-6 DNA methylase [Succinivibrio sp.]
MNFLEYFNVKESYQVSEKLLSLLLQNPNELFAQYVKEHDLSSDDLMADFQLNDASRDSLKQDFTPEGIAELAAKLLPSNFESAADVCSGTGALTIQLWKINPSAYFHCEEFSERTVPFLLFNLMVRNIEGEVLCGDALTQDYKHVYKLSKGLQFSVLTEVERIENQLFDVLISNPPYSLKWDQENRACFKYGIAPAKAADYAFIQYGLSLLKDDGKSCFILPHGILFRGNTEGEIRQALIEDHIVDAIIGLPNNCFMCTSIPVHLLIFDKKKSKDLLVVDASTLYEKEGKFNKIKEEHINKILGLYSLRSEVEKLAHVATYEEVAKNEFNLNIPRYVNSFEYIPPPPLEKTINELVVIEEELFNNQNKLLNDISSLKGFSIKEQQAIESWKWSLTMHGAILNEELAEKPTR